jgi:hypothetical protein
MVTIIGNISESDRDATANRKAGPVVPRKPRWRETQRNHDGMKRIISQMKRCTRGRRELALLGDS